MSVTQAEVRQLKEGRFLVVDEEPCKILSISHSKPGKHGAAKARMDVIGLFDGQKRSVVHTVTDKVKVPMIDKRKAQIVAVLGENVQLMDLETYDTFELPLPTGSEGEELGVIEPGNELMYMEALGRRKITRVDS